jgi:hypothetical protein
MNIEHAFFVCLAITISGLLLAIVNMLFIIREGLSDNNLRNGLVVHGIAAVLYFIGGLFTIGFGIAWIVTYLKH